MGFSGSGGSLARAKTFNILDYGGDPSGVLDSTGAITAVKAAAGAGSRNIILIPPGTYLTAPFTLDGFYWAGYGPKSSVLKAKAGSANFVTNNTTATNEIETTVEGLGFDGTNLTGTATVFVWSNGLQGNNSAPTLIMRDCWVGGGPALGIDTTGGGGALSDCHFEKITTHNNGTQGWSIGSDQRLVNCISAQNGSEGFYISGANADSFALIGCKAYANGNVNPFAGYGYHLTGTSTGGALSGCLAQDNQAAGLIFDSTQNPGGGYIVTGLVCDTNSRDSGGFWAAVEFFDAPGNYISYTAIDRVNGTYQKNALKMDSLSIGNIVECSSFYYTTSGTPTSWFLSGNGAGNALHLGNSDGMQAPAFAATLTPDVPTGGKVNVGALTAAITINAPTNPFVGARLDFEFLQDGVGGRAVSWNAIFKFQVAWTNVGNTLGKQSTASFVYDGTNWVSQSSVANAWF